MIAGSLVATVATVLGLLMCSFFFSGTETAFFSLQEIDRRRIAEQRTPTHAAIHRLIQRRTALITTILMGNETANVTISALTAVLVAQVVPGKPWVTVAVVTPMLVLFTEITPKVLAFRFRRRWVDLAVWPLTLFSLVVTPLRAVVSALVATIARLAGVSDAHEQRAIGEDEFLVLVDGSMDAGVVGEEEREIIEAVFELDDLPVVRLMTPKPDIFALPLDVSWEALLTAIREARFSRIPIYEGAPDEIVGVLLVKDLLRHRHQPLDGPEALRALLVAPVFVPETKPANAMMKEMIRRRLHMAFVVDEHGTLTGLVSLDDLIIELVGELGEDTDDDADGDIEVVDENTLRVSAGVDLEDFTEATGIPVPEGDYHTLAGYVLAELGRIPTEGDEVTLDPHRIVVEELDGRRITWLQLVQDPDTHADGGGG